MRKKCSLCGKIWFCEGEKVESCQHEQRCRCLECLKISNYSPKQRLEIFGLCFPKLRDAEPEQVIFT